MGIKSWSHSAWKLQWSIKFDIVKYSTIEITLSVSTYIINQSCSLCIFVNGSLSFCRRCLISFQEGIFFSFKFTFNLCSQLLWGLSSTDGSSSPCWETATSPNLQSPLLSLRAVIFTRHRTGCFLHMSPASLHSTMSVLALNRKALVLNGSSSEV